jgi:hypothetical protein
VALEGREAMDVRLVSLPWIVTIVALFYPFTFGLMMMDALGKVPLINTKFLEAYIVLTGAVVGLITFSQSAKLKSGGVASLAMTLLKTVSRTGFLEVCALFVGLVLALLPRLI